MNTQYFKQHEIKFIPGYRISGKRSLSKRILRHWQLYLLLLLPAAYVIIFNYVPMYGIQIAFKDFVISKGIIGSPWVGFKHFTSFIGSYQFERLLLNTIGISFYSITAGFAPPIILAIAINECRLSYYKKFVQLVTYAPSLFSTVVIVGVLVQVLSLQGAVNNLFDLLGFDRISFISNPNFFKSIYVWSGIWQSTGFGAIIYIAALSGINPELQEAARIDGANIWKRIWHIDLVGIIPTAIILLILSTAGILNVGFEKVWLLQNPQNMRTSDVISTYVYRVGLVGMNISFASAVGLFQSVVSFMFLLVVNKIAKMLSETSIW